MGWVSILDNQELKSILNIPGPAKPVAYLCLGYVTSFPERPMLEDAGWEKRVPLEELIFWNAWGQKCQ